MGDMSSVKIAVSLSGVSRLGLLVVLLLPGELVCSTVASLLPGSLRAGLFAAAVFSDEIVDSAGFSRWEESLNVGKVGLS
jgi:hypothetical protein